MITAGWAQNASNTSNLSSPGLIYIYSSSVFTSIESFGFVQLTSKCSYYHIFDNVDAVSLACMPGAESKLAMMEYQFEAEAFP